MRIKNILKSSVVLCAGVLLLIGSTVASASDDNKKFNFSMPAKSQNVYSTTEYRQTTNPNNNWKVNLVTSTEGGNTHTKANFWLAKYYKGSHVMASNTYTVKEGSGAHYYPATSLANQSHVALGCENNNYVNKSYIVSGYWDEETN